MTTTNNPSRAIRPFIQESGSHTQLRSARLVFEESCGSKTVQPLDTAQAAILYIRRATSISGSRSQSTEDGDRQQQSSERATERGGDERKSLEMDARPPRRSSAPAAGAALRLLLLFPMLLLGSRVAAAQGGDAGGMTELQKHAAFFDSDKDGVVSFSETYNAFRDFGFGITASTLSATFINGLLGPKTRPENETSRLSVYIENIHKGIHGSDSGAYDAQGRFVPEKFDAIFSKHGKTVPDALTSAEVDELISANREPSDYAGWAGASAEWKILYSIGKDKDGLLRKEDARGVYDGSLFARLVQEKRRS